MTKRKGVLQKVSLVSAVVSFVLAIIAGVMLYLRVDDVGMGNPISASLLASTFFFVCVGATLIIMGRADIPSFIFDDSDGADAG